MESAENEQAPLEEKIVKKNWMQKILGIPLVGPYLAFGVGLFIPAAIWFFVFQGSEIGQFETIILGVVILIWNLLLLKVWRVNICTPLIPIPIWLLGIIFIVSAAFQGG